MKMPLIANETTDLNEPQNMEYFRSPESLLINFEIYDVSDEMLFLFDAEGRKLELCLDTTEDGKCNLSVKVESKPTHQKLLFKLLKIELASLAKDDRFGVSENKAKAAQKLSDLVELIPKNLYCRN